MSESLFGIDFDFVRDGSAHYADGPWAPVLGPRIKVPRKLKKRLGKLGYREPLDWPRWRANLVLTKPAWRGTFRLIEPGVIEFAEPPTPDDRGQK